tara:strand:- start:23657 stop:23869 length:213 start_codon:yes stop_codon:yes gene_type:complete
MSTYENNPLTVYLGESGKPHDSKRVDILPSESSTNNKRIVVSVDNDGIRISDITGGDQETLWSIKFKEVT